MFSEYKCTIKCFWHDGLVKEGETVIADDSEMKGNGCFVKVKKAEPKVEPKAEPKVVEAKVVEAKPEKKVAKASLKNLLDGDK